MHLLGKKGDGGGGQSDVKGKDCGWGLGIGVWGLGIEVWGLRFGVWGLHGLCLGLGRGLRFGA